MDFNRQNKNIGIVFLSIDEEMLHNICSGGDSSSVVYSFIVDQEGKLVSYKEKELLGSAVGRPDQDKKEKYQIFAEEQKIFGKDDISIDYVHDEKLNWDIVNVSNRHEVLDEINQQQKITFTTLAVSLGFLIVIIAILTRELTGSIKSVVRIMQSAEEGRPQERVRIDKKMPNEVKVIAYQYNTTMDRLLESVEKEKRLDRQKKDAEIMALEAQLNPHFLYNTLDTINWIAIGRKEFEISRAITALAVILRYGIDDSNGIVTIREEYEWLRQYLFLQQTRLKDEFEINIHIPPELMELKVHKLLFQPFVENSFIHGFENIKRKPVLKISMELWRQDKVRIVVEDNGKGMPGEIADQMNRGIFWESGDKNQIGLKNAMYRISLYYEDQAEIQVESRENEFTRITITLPITTSEDPNLIYFVDCGDFNPDTASSGDAVGKSQSVTDKIYGPDESGTSWGVVTSDDGEESISVPADTAAGRAGSLGVYTTYQWAHERQTADTAKEESFRYAREQGSFESRYVKYRFDLEPGRYLVTVGVGNSWGNAANPDIYAGTAGDPEKDAKLNPEPLNIPELGHETVQKKVAVPQGKNSLDVYVLSKEATLQVNYIRIEKAPEGEETLTKLKIKKTPKKLIYQFNEAQELNTEGLSVAAVYSDGYEELLSLDDCTITGFSGNTPGTQTITVSYTKGDVTVKAVFEIKVEEQQGENPGPGITKTLTGLRIKTMPAKTVYQLNETLNTEGMTVAAVYSDNSEEPVQLTDCTITGFSGDKAGTQTITVTYTKGAITVNADFQIEVKTSGGGQEPVDPEQPVKPVSLTIQPPTKKEYQLGEQLNLEGMVLTLTFSDETTSTITAEDCTVAGFDNETAGEKTIKITYKDKNNVSVSGEFKVTVLVPESAKLESLIIDSKPNKTQYKLNEAKELNTEGMKVTAVYSGGIKKVLQAKDYQVTGFAGNKLGEQIITVTYTEKDMTVQDVFKITVVPAEQTGAVVPASLKVTSPKKTEYLIGEQLVLDGMILTVKYSDGTEKKVEAKDCVISGFDSSKEGTRNVVVSYTEKGVTVTDFFAVKIVKSPAAPKTYRVFYHDNKGGKVSGMPSDTNAYVVNAAAVVKGNPVSTSKFFAGWNTQANGQGKSYAAGSRITINGEVHLYAQWKTSYTAKDKLKYKVTGKQAVSCVGTANKKASSIKIPDSVKYNGITYKVTSIGAKAFYKNAKLKTVKIGNQVTKIGASAFASNKKLASVTIGKGMKSIESKAFYKDAKLKKVSIKSSKLKTVKKSAFKGVYKKAKISVPKKKAKAYKKLLKKAGLPSKASVK